MSQSVFVPAARASLLAAVLGLCAGASLASTDLTISLATCSPGSAVDLQRDLKQNNGAVRKSGRNPPSRYFCPVPVDDDEEAASASTASWNTLELQYSDLNVTSVGNITARLMRKSLTTGAAVSVARAVSTSPTAFGTAQARIRAPLDFSQYGYFIIVEMETPSLAIDAHTVRLTTR